MPLVHRALVEAAGSRWINAKPSKYAKYIAYFLDKCGKWVLEYEHEYEIILNYYIIILYVMICWYLPGT